MVTGRLAVACDHIFLAAFLEYFCQTLRMLVVASRFKFDFCWCDFELLWNKLKECKLSNLVAVLLL